MTSVLKVQWFLVFFLCFTRYVSEAIIKFSHFKFYVPTHLGEDELLAEEEEEYGDASGQNWRHEPRTNFKEKT